MADGQGMSVLRRKAEAGRTSVAASREITPCKALSNAIVQTADSRLGLVVSVSSCSGRIGTLPELLETLPEEGLLAVLEGPGEAQGLMVLDAAMLSAVIEMLMTGKLSSRPPQPRRPTRTDAALSADLIDDILRGFEAPFLGQAQARWAAGFGYGSFLDDPRPLGLMLEDIDYRIFRIAGEAASGARPFGLMLALPAAGRGLLGRQGAGAGPGASAGAAGPPGGPERRTGQRRESDRGAGAGPSAPEEPDAVPWEAALERQVMAGRVRLTAILHRMHLPLARLGALQVGETLPIPGSALDETAVVGADDRPVAVGRLGQSGGHRAVRLQGEEGMSGSAAPAGPGAAFGGPAGPAALPGQSVPGAASGRPGAMDAAAPPPPGEAGAAPDLPHLPPLQGLPEPDGPPEMPEAGGDGLPDLPPLDALPDAST
jgi:flagellar motor switch protein FliM